MKIEIPITITKEDRFNKILGVLSCGHPFNKLRKREKEVLAEMYRINLENIDLPIETRNKILFNKDTRKAISLKLDMSIDAFNNITMSLRKKGILEGDGFIKKYTLGKIDEINFKFIEE